MSKRFMKLSVISLMCAGALPVFAAKPVDLSHQNINYLKSITSLSKTLAATPTGTDLKEVSQSTDFNQTVHMRVTQNYAGFPVWGGDAVIHTPQGKNKSLRSLIASTESAKSTMNGTVYEDLQKDLQNTPAYVFNAEQAEKAFTHAIADFESKKGARAEIINQKKELMVYVDDNNKAHWAFFVRAKVKTNGKLSIPAYILDAVDFNVYEEWNDRKTAHAEPVKGGGVGGNSKAGKVYYDGLSVDHHLAKLDIMRDAVTRTCYLQNSLAKVIDARKNTIAEFSCEKPDSQHDNLFWNAGNDAVNGGYSPNNDALFAASVVNDMYQGWYKIPVLTKNKKPMLLTMKTHFVFVDDEGSTKDNAAWDDDTETMYFGDGEEVFYPLTSSVGVAGHEMSHGFTAQHSNLVYNLDSGGMNESFSDMADQAVKYFATGKSDFVIGAEIIKENFSLPVLRYMEKPSQDGLSADKLSDYEAYNKQARREGRRPMNVHFSSGIFNRAFYLLATSKGWNVKMAFDVMVQANSHYWVKRSTFKQGACGVLQAAADYKAKDSKYDIAAVKNAFTEVGIDTKRC